MMRVTWTTAQPSGDAEEPPAAGAGGSVGGRGQPLVWGPIASLASSSRAFSALRGWHSTS
jgi:hypothetical protein